MEKGHFIRSKSDLMHFLKTESEYYGIKSWRMPLLAVSENQILWKHAALLRKTEYHTNTGNTLLSVFYRARLRRLQRKYCLRIPINVFDCGLRIKHLAPVSANSKARVGKNCTMHVYAGIVAGGTNDFSPQLGDDIVLGMGSIVLGNVTLADGIVVGANALVNKSFPEKNITVAGVPAKQISGKGSESWKKDSREEQNKIIESTT